MLYWGPHTVFVIDSTLNIIYRGIWHTTTLKDIQPLLGGLSHQLVFDDAVEYVAVFDPKSVGDETRICLPFWLANLVTQYTVEFVIAATYGHVGVFGLVCSVWDNRGWKNVSRSVQPSLIMMIGLISMLTYHGQFPIFHCPSSR